MADPTSRKQKCTTFRLAQDSKQQASGSQAFTLRSTTTGKVGSKKLKDIRPVELASLLEDGTSDAEMHTSATDAELQASTAATSEDFQRSGTSAGEGEAIPVAAPLLTKRKKRVNTTSVSRITCISCMILLTHILSRTCSNGFNSETPRWMSCFDTMA